MTGWRGWYLSLSGRIYNSAKRWQLTLPSRAGLTALFLISTVFLVVFFGIRAGLQPLSSVEQAISIRSSTDFRPIRRNVPVEVQHIVQRLNNLFNEVTEEQAGRDRFIRTLHINCVTQLRRSSHLQKLRKMRQIWLRQSSEITSWLTPAGPWPDLQNNCYLMNGSGTGRHVNRPIPLIPLLRTSYRLLRIRWLMQMLSCLFPVNAATLL